MLAKKMGLPLKKLIISVNENDEFPKFLQSGKYSKVEPSLNCLSNAMNVGHPSNLARLITLYGGEMDEKGNIVMEADMQQMQSDIFSISIADSETRETIKDAWQKHKLLLEPHGSVGWKGLMNYIESEGIDKEQLCISLETAHPAKFPDEIISILGINPDLPESLKGLEGKDEHLGKLKNEYTAFKSFLLENF